MITLPVKYTADVKGKTCLSEHRPARSATPIGFQRLMKNVKLQTVIDEGVLKIWHSHDGEQILIAVGGKGYFQEKGEVSRVIQSGDVIFIKAGHEHWHSASPCSILEHTVISTGTGSTFVTWLKKR